VQFAAPTEQDLRAFFDAMDANRDRHMLVHCAANLRVSAFLGLYGVIREERDRDDAFALMRGLWEPNDVWADFIEQMLSNKALASRA
jgi:predicted protein tyrosine phosphatase